MTPINVLSLFDGISCGRLALERAGIHVDNYFASEIDPYALIVSQRHYPDTIHLGDVRGICGCNLPKIDLLIGGSPCQGFSIAGKEFNFDDPRSALFFEYVRILKECDPTYWLLENVPMKKEYRDVISDILGVEPVQINSALVSAQSRKRLYWANFPIQQPADKDIKLEDVVLQGALIDRDKSHAIIGSIGRTTHREYFRKNQGQLVFNTTALSSLYGGLSGTRPRVYIEKSPTVAAGSGHIPLVVNGQPKDLTIAEIKGVTRKLTPLECERLQTLPDNWTAGVSDTQRYKSIGNAWTVDVIAHILKGVVNPHI
jgi:DNA (cytosine-5)-methyltransferase 3A